MENESENLSAAYMSVCSSSSGVVSSDHLSHLDLNATRGRLLDEATLGSSPAVLADRLDDTPVVERDTVHLRQHIPSQKQIDLTS